MTTLEEHPDTLSDILSFVHKNRTMVRADQRETYEQELKNATTLNRAFEVPVLMCLLNISDSWEYLRMMVELNRSATEEDGTFMTTPFDASLAVQQIYTANDDWRFEEESADSESDDSSDDDDE